MFKDEYRLNTWRDQLRVLAQPILISVIVIGVIFSTSQFMYGFNITEALNKATSIFSKPKYKTNFFSGIFVFDRILNRPS
jgi:hypothetical protein